MIATIIILFLEILKLGSRIPFHGKEVKFRRNFFIDMVGFIISMVLFYFAGLFDKFNL